MTELVTRIAVFSVLGAICAFVSGAWTKHLQKERELEYKLSSSQEILILIAMVFCGALLGIATEGILIPCYGLILLCICGAVGVIDWTHRIIPNETVFAVLMLKLMLCMPSVFGIGNGPSFDVVQSLIGFGVCFIVFMIPGLLGSKVGAGDVKLAAAMGFLLGIQSAFTGVVVMGVMILGYGLIQRRIPVLRFFKENIPMGPFIASGMFLAYVGSNYSI